MECHGLQCGFCTPGMMMTARALLDRNPDPTRAGDPRGDLRADLPLHRLRDDRPLRAVGRRARRPGTRTVAEPGGELMTTIEERRRRPFEDNDQKPRRPRPDAAQGGPALHPRQGPLRRRPAAARHAAPGDPALADGARPDRQHRHHAPPQAHPKVKAVVTGADAGRAGPGLDADPVQRRAGRAGHRQGPLPGPGGRLRRRRGPLRGPRRAGADRRRVRRRSTRSSTCARRSTRTRR